MRGFHATFLSALAVHSITLPIPVQGAVLGETSSSLVQQSALPTSPHTAASQLHNTLTPSQSLTPVYDLAHWRTVAPKPLFNESGRFSTQKNYLFFRQRGFRTLDWFDIAPLDDKYYPPLQSFYRWDIMPDFSPAVQLGKDTARAMQYVGIDTFAHFISFQTYAIDTVSQPALLPYHNAYSRSKGVLLSIYNDRTFDDNPDSLRLPWSEQRFQEWRIVNTVNDCVDHISLASLRWVVRSNIINYATANLLRSVHLSRGIPIDGKGTITPNDTEYFPTLVGCDNVNGVELMAADHKTSLDSKRIVKIHTWPPVLKIDNKFGRDGNPLTRQPVMILELGRSSLTEQTRKTRKSKNRHGEPIKLSSKVLAALPDPHDESAVFVAESGGTATKIDLKNRTPSPPYRGPTNPTAPLTSLATNPSRTTLLAGSWDKAIWSWSLATRAPSRRYTGGHTDFVKCIATARLSCSSRGTTTNADEDDDGEEILISGGADARVVVWRLRTGEKLHTLRGHSRGVLDLAVELPSAGIRNVARGQVTVFAAGSDRSIRRWRVGAASAEVLPFRSGERGGGEALVRHETSVNKLHFSFVSPGEEDERDEGPRDGRPTLYTASSDKTALALTPISEDDEAQTATDYAVALKLEHPDFVRSVVVAVAGTDGAPPLLATACRDENVRVFDLSDEGRLLRVFRGHFEEVSDLVVRRVGGAEVLVSAGIDGTVRVWSLSGAELARGEGEDEDEGEDGAGEEKKSGVVVTEEEERELAELMMEED